MSLFKVFDVAGSALSAQTVRLNTTASNLANAESVAGKPEDIYRARHPVFATVLDDASRGVKGVKVADIVESGAPGARRYEPGHPLADAQGYIYSSNVNAVEEMANMISASRSYQSNLEVMNTSKQLLLRLLSLGDI